MHVARMGEESGVYRVLVGKPEGRSHDNYVKCEFYKPRRVTLGNTRHFVEELTKIVRESPKIIKYVF